MFRKIAVTFFSRQSESVGVDSDIKISIVHLLRNVKRMKTVMHLNLRNKINRNSRNHARVADV